MNRIEIIGLFTAMKALSDVKAYDKLAEVIEKTLAAAEGRVIADGKYSSEKPKSQKLL